MEECETAYLADIVRLCAFVDIVTLVIMIVIG